MCRDQHRHRQDAPRRSRSKQRCQRGFDSLADGLVVKEFEQQVPKITRSTGRLCWWWEASIFAKAAKGSHFGSGQSVETDTVEGLRKQVGEFVVADFERARAHFDHQLGVRQGGLKTLQRVLRGRILLDENNHPLTAAQHRYFPRSVRSEAHTYEHQSL